MAKTRTKNAVKVLESVTGNDLELQARIENEMLNARISMMIYDARTKAGLSQAILAKLIGTTQSVIARLEDAEYRGHSLSMLQRIATALGKGIAVSWTALGRKPEAA